MQGGLFFVIFRNFKLEIWFFRVGYGAIHLYQMKGYPCVFKFPEYGNLWFCDDPNHKGKCTMSKLQTYIPRGVIFDGVWIVIFPDIVFYRKHRNQGVQRGGGGGGGDGDDGGRISHLPPPPSHAPRKKYTRKGFPSLRYVYMYVYL